MCLAPLCRFVVLLSHPYPRTLSLLYTYISIQLPIHSVTSHKPFFFTFVLSAPTHTRPLSYSAPGPSIDLKTQQSNHIRPLCHPHSATAISQLSMRSFPSSLAFSISLVFIMSSLEKKPLSVSRFAWWSGGMGSGCGSLFLCQCDRRLYPQSLCLCDNQTHPSSIFHSLSAYFPLIYYSISHKNTWYSLSPPTVSLALFRPQSRGKYIVFWSVWSTTHQRNGHLPRPAKDKITPAPSEKHAV